MWTPIRALLVGATLYAVLATSAFAEFHFVAVDGVSTAAGTIDDPWDLRSALKRTGDDAAPGDTIWIRGGLYTGTYLCTLAGEFDRPIVVRAYPGERVTIDGLVDDRAAGILEIKARFTWFWGLELMSSDPQRIGTIPGNSTANIPRPVGVFIGHGAGDGRGCRFINMIIHDTAEGHWFTAQATDAEVYGNVIYNNGWIAPDRSHGHGVYVRNASGEKRVAENIILNQFGFGVHCWSDQGQVQNIRCEGNISFNNGSIGDQMTPNIYFGNGSVNCTIVGNYAYDAAEGLALLYGSEIGNAQSIVIADNVFAAPDHTALALGTLSGDSEFLDNTVIGACDGLPDDAYQNGNVQTPDGSALRVVVQPNEYESGRAHVTIYNWSQQPLVSVDLSSVLSPGQSFRVMDAQDFYGWPVAGGEYTGQPVAISMVRTDVVAPIGVDAAGDPLAAPPHTSPEFASFVVTADPVDSDGDGVLDAADVCPDGAAVVGTDPLGGIPGDLDRDCDVDDYDLHLFTLCLGGANEPPADTCPAGVQADLDGDGDVDADDMNTQAANYTGEITPVCPNSVAPAGRDEFGRPLGDLNEDCTVTLTDFSLFALCFGGANQPPSATCPIGVVADFDHDKDVDLSDFSIFALNYTGAE